MLKKSRKNFTLLVVCGLAVFLGGCEATDSQPAAKRSSQSAQPLATAAPNYYLILDQPIVTINNGTTTITGSLHRKPGVRWLLAGRVDIEFVGPDGYLLDELPALIQPGTVSMDPNVPSIYSTSYGYVPPPGSTIRVHFVDSDTAAREDMDGYDFYGPGGGAADHAQAQAGGHKAAAAAHANHYGNHNSGFGAGFGVH